MKVAARVGQSAQPPPETSSVPPTEVLPPAMQTDIHHVPILRSPSGKVIGPVTGGGIEGKGTTGYFGKIPSTGPSAPGGSSGGGGGGFNFNFQNPFGSIAQFSPLKIFGGFPPSIAQMAKSVRQSMHTMLETFD